MKALLLLESLGLGGGGAERQVCTLAEALKRRGVNVEVLTYIPGHFYLPLLTAAGIPYRCLPGEGRLSRVASVRRALRTGTQDVVVAFLRGPCIYAELAALPTRAWGLVVCERVSVPSRQRVTDWRRWLHLVADGVTTNSHTNRLLAQRAVPALARKMVTIYNAVDLREFEPTDIRGGDGTCLRLAVAARLHPQKNMAGLMRAVARLRKPPDSLQVEVDWYGASADDNGRRGCGDTAALVTSLGLDGVFRLNPPTSRIAHVYQGADVVVLPSFYEGLPNAVCEAMACGRPILMSRVCDAGALVREGGNGFLFDPADPESIAGAIRRFACLSLGERRRMGAESRRVAERLFDPEAFAGRYLAVLEAAASRRGPKLDHWAPEVPETAVASAAALAGGRAFA